MAAARRPSMEIDETHENGQGIVQHEDHDGTNPPCLVQTTQGIGNFRQISSEGPVTINQDIRHFNGPVSFSPEGSFSSPNQASRSAASKTDYFASVQAEREKKIKLHHAELAVELERTITPKQLNSLVMFLEGTCGEMGKINQFSDLWRELIQRKEIAQGRYAILEKGLSSMQEAGHLQTIKEFKQKMRSEDGRYEGWVHDESVVTSIEELRKLEQVYQRVLESGRRGVLFTNAAISNIGDRGGKVRLTNGSVELEVPPGTVNMTHLFWIYVTFSHGALTLNARDTQFAAKPVSEEVTNSDGIVKYSIPVRLGPSGVNFKGPVRLTIKDLSKPPSEDVSSMLVYRKADGDNRWQRAGSCFYNRNNTATVVLNQFSSYVLGLPVLSDLQPLNVRVMALNNSVNTDAERAKNELVILFTVNDYSFSKEFILHNRKSIKSATCLYLDPKSDIRVTWARSHLMGKESVEYIQQGILYQHDIHNLAEMPVSLSLAGVHEDDHRSKELDSQHEDVLILEQNGAVVAELPLSTNPILAAKQADTTQGVDQETEHLISSTQDGKTREEETMLRKVDGARLGDFSVSCTAPHVADPARESVASNTRPEQSQQQMRLKAVSVNFTSVPESQLLNIKPVTAIPPPGAPRRALGQKPTRHSIPIDWKADTKRFSITHFTVAYKASASEDWVELETPGSDCAYTLKGLRAGTDYTLRVQAHSQTGSSAPSNVSSIATVSRSAGQIARDDLKKRSKCILSKNEGMAIYQAPLIEVKNEEAEKIHMFDLGNRSALPKPEKVILVVGATGAGKSTLINGILNYVLGVEWEENIRFRLVDDTASFVSQHKSQTRSINIYTLHHQHTFKVPYTIRVIDTPGFGDIEGIRKDKLITECIYNLFTNQDYGIDHIDAIGFVAQSSQARLTPTKKYIFETILSLFGKDIEDNIFLLLTFSDSHKPPIIARAREVKLPFKSYFQFDNAALYARNVPRDNDVDRLFWNMNVMSFKKFLSELKKVEGKSLALTKELLEERQQLEVHIAEIQKGIYDGLTKLEQIRVRVDVVKQHEADIERYKDFTYTVDENKQVKVDLEPGIYVNNCLHCNRTCHYPCTNDEGEAGCWAMDSSGNCKVCSCTSKLHRKVPDRFDVEVVQVTKTGEELKRRCETAKKGKMNAEKLRDQILEDFHNLEMKVLHMTGEVRRCLERLSEIALRPNPLSSVEYIDILINSERAAANPGFQARIDQLECIKDQAIALNRMAEEGYDPFEQYRHTLELAKTAHQRPSLDAEAAYVRKTAPSNSSNLREKVKTMFEKKNP